MWLFPFDFNAEEREYNVLPINYNGTDDVFSLQFYEV